MSLHVQPDFVDQVNVLGLHRGRVRTDAVGLDCASVMHYLENKLPLRIRRGLPSLAQAKSLLWAGHLAGTSRNHRGRLKRIGGLNDSGEDITRWHYQKGDRLALVLGNGHRFGEEALLVVAEDLVHGNIILTAAIAAQARLHHHHVGLARVRNLDGPAQVVQVVVVAHCHQNVLRTKLNCRPVNGLLLHQVKMLFHLLFDMRKFTLVDFFGDQENQKKCAGKYQSGDRRNSLGENVDNRGR